MGVLAPAGAAGQRLDRKTLTPTLSHRAREEEALAEWWGVCERAAFGGGELGVSRAVRVFSIGAYIRECPNGLDQA